MNRLAIGQILKSHGVKGYVKVRTFSGETEHFAKIKTVFLERNQRCEEFEVEAADIGSIDIRMKLKGIDSPEDAKKLGGAVILVERKFAAPLQKGEFYIADLCRCTVYRNSKPVGRVQNAWDNGSGTILEILADGGGLVMVPFNDVFVGHVETEKKKLFLKEDISIF